MAEGAWRPDPGFWRDRRVAVTGATGFLGSHVTAKLVELGADVVVLVRDALPPTPISAAWIDQVAAVSGPVEDQAVVERMLGDYEVQTVLHLAAQSQVGVANRNPVGTFEANVTGTWALLEAVRRSPRVTAVVTASSDKAYGAQPNLPYDEAMPLLAVNPYDVSKACADLISQSYHQTFDVPVCVTRCGNFFGPGDRNWQRLVPGTIRSLLRGERPLIRSDGTMVRDYLYVVDGALAYLQLVEAMAEDPSIVGEAFNYSTEQPLTVLELVAALQAAAGTDLAPEIQATATHEIDSQYLSAAKARKLLGWTPTYTVEEALAATVDWYRAHLDDADG
jgi:CDP-glucose 4,6-dehydratase